MAASKESGEGFSEASAACEFALPRRKILCSLTAGWTSLLVRRFESSSSVEAFETLPTPDQLVVVVTGGHRDVESFSGGRWRKAVYRPGCVSMTPAGRVDRLRWRSLAPAPVESLHLYIPQKFFSDARDEYRRAGARVGEQPLDSLSFVDPVVSRVALSLAGAMEAGAPDLYAQSAAQFLATHLLSAQSGWPDSSLDSRQPETLADRRLSRVLEYMNDCYMEPLTLEQLAREACVSRFHFGRLFKEKIGVTPHRHLVNLRMGAAGSMLGETQMSVFDIALACGYQSAAHFTAAFQRHFSQTPSSYRQGRHGGAAAQAYPLTHGE